MILNNNNGKELNDLFISFEKEMQSDTRTLYPKLRSSESAKKLLDLGKGIIVPAGKFINENQNKLVRGEWIALLSWIVKGGSGSENKPSPLDTIDIWTKWCLNFMVLPVE